MVICLQAAPASLITDCLCRFISRYFAHLPGKPVVAKLLPSRSTLVAFVAASAVAAASCIWVQGGVQGPGSGSNHDVWQRGATHVGIGVACLAMLLAQLSRTERHTLRQLLQLRQEPPGAREHKGGGHKED